MKSDLCIGASLRVSRTLRGLTQLEVGTRSGLSRQAVSQLEKSIGKMSSLTQLAEVTPIRFIHLPHAATVGESLSEARRRRRWAVSKLAEITGLAANTVRSVEANRGTLATLQRIASVLVPRAQAKAVPPDLTKRSFPTILAAGKNVRDPSDHYSTPLPIVRSLLRHERINPDATILEPAVGKLRVIEHALKEAGYAHIDCFDINGEGKEQRDFFNVTERFDVVITNPPFRLASEFVQHAKTVATRTVIMLLPINLLHGAARLRDLWSDRTFPLARVYVLARGVDFAAPEPLADTFATSQMYVAWFVFERDHEGDPTVRWIDNGPWVRRAKS